MRLYAFHISPKYRNQLKSLLGIETRLVALLRNLGFLDRNQLKSLLGIETKAIPLHQSFIRHRNQLKSLLGIET